MKASSMQERKACAGVSGPRAEQMLAGVYGSGLSCQLGEKGAGQQLGGFGTAAIHLGLQHEAEQPLRHLSGPLMWLWQPQGLGAVAEEDAVGLAVATLSPRLWHYSENHSREQPLMLQCSHHAWQPCSASYGSHRQACTRSCSSHHCHHGAPTVPSCHASPLSEAGAVPVCITSPHGCHRLPRSCSCCRNHLFQLPRTPQPAAGTALSTSSAWPGKQGHGGRGSPVAATHSSEAEQPLQHPLGPLA